MNYKIDVNPINLERLNEWWTKINSAMQARNGTSEPWNMAVAATTSLACEFAGAAAAAGISIAYDVRAIRESMQKENQDA